jgi:EF-P beta-lysylation protein EpmB
LETPQWQRDLARSFTDPLQLLAYLNVRPESVADLDLEDSPFPFRVTRHFASLMRRGDPDDPLLAQVLPRRAERQSTPGFSSDPVGDLAAVVNPGLLQKYRGRALAIVTGACAVHCRYCFRRHFPYHGNTSMQHWHQVLDALRQRTDVNELILSGGDPLSLSDRRLQQIIEETENSRNIIRLRIHTRQPVVLPNRVSETLCRSLSDARLQAVIVLHINHPNEICADLHDAVDALRGAGCTLLNQAVLLKNVNDDADTLVELSESLFNAGILPYYLHLLDAVDGAAHFGVALPQAIELERSLRARLPGYLVPRLVREVEGATEKTPVSQL